jgi:Ca-activated chloride channel family protein
MNPLDSLLAGLQPFHFLRPLWLVAVPLLCAVALLCARRRHRHQGSWAGLIDPDLLDGLRLDQPGSTPSASPWPLLALIWSLVALALAGPSCQQLTTPGFRAPAAWVVVLDLSPSMSATDVPPNRVTRARYAIDDLLSGAEDARLGLIVFSDEAYTVAPLTEDVNTVRALLGPLSPQIMPSAGDHLAPALAEAGHLLAKSGTPAQHVIVLTDGFDDPAAAFAAAGKLRSTGATVDVVGIGTAGGAPLASADGGFSRDAQGQPRLSRLDSSLLQQLAAAGGGRYADTGGLPALIKRLQATAGEDGAAIAGNDIKIEHWRDAGIWLLPMILLLSAALARRQWL